MSALAEVRASPGLGTYLDVLELRLEQAVLSHPGLVSQVGTETLAAGGRLRPVLVFLATSPDLRDDERPLAAGVSVELVHMATLVHDDLLDAAVLGRGHPTAWATHGEAAARAGGDYLFARAFSELAGSATRPPSRRSRARPSLARGEALQRRQTFRPDTSVEDYLLRCSLKTGSSSRPPVGSAAAGSTWAPSDWRWEWRSRLRTTSSTASERRRDRQGARRRPPRRDTHAAAHRRARGRRRRPGAHR